jgi:hypothetical protein
MDAHAPRSDDRHQSWWDDREDRVAPGDRSSGPSEASWLGEIAEQLERDPSECWLALEGLTAVEQAARPAIIAELSCHRTNAGVRTLLRLLSAARDPVTRQAARSALQSADAGVFEASGQSAPAPRPSACDESRSGSAHGAIRAVTEGTASRPIVPGRSGIRLARCLVTAVDGQGRGSIVVSISQVDQRRTAAFWCDVQRGILDVVGEVEPESPEAGRLVDEFVQQAVGACVGDAPELALGLLGGSLMLGGPRVSSRVRDWLDGTLGPEFRPSEFPVMIPGLERTGISDEQMPARSGAILRACPSWRDTSPLTYELAEEISLREGRVAADPERDAGAYRFLFEHRLIDRLELYGRMLMWMAWLWHSSGDRELSRSALVLAGQLSNEQYAVPSHPFLAALTTRSLDAALARLRGPEDPRWR